MGSIVKWFLLPAIILFFFPVVFSLDYVGTQCNTQNHCFDIYTSKTAVGENTRFRIIQKYNSLPQSCRIIWTLDMNTANEKIIGDSQFSCCLDGKYWDDAFYTFDRLGTHKIYVAAITSDPSEPCNFGSGSLSWDVGVYECVSNFQCSSGQLCINNVCKSNYVCGDNICSPGEACNTDASSCTDSTCYEPACNNGCSQTPVPAGQEDESCSGSYQCDGSGNCVPKSTCGNYVCDTGENYETCPTDCSLNSCAPPACPSGFSDKGIQCSSDTCTRSCTSSSCGNWEQVAYSNKHEHFYGGADRSRRVTSSIMNYYFPDEKSYCYKAVHNGGSIDYSYIKGRNSEYDTLAYTIWSTASSSNAAWFSGMPGFYSSGLKPNSIIIDQVTDDDDFDDRSGVWKNSEIYCAPTTQACSEFDTYCDTDCYGSSISNTVGFILTKQPGTDYFEQNPSVPRDRNYIRYLNFGDDPYEGFVYRAPYVEQTTNQQCKYGSVCGDKICAADETPQSCLYDCGFCKKDIDCNDFNAETKDVCLYPASQQSTCIHYRICGDNICSPTESPFTCFQDCGFCKSDADCNDEDPQTADTCINPATPQSICINIGPVCGDNMCNGDETTLTCPEDCRSLQTIGQQCEENSECTTGFCSLTGVCDTRLVPLSCATNSDCVHEMAVCQNNKCVYNMSFVSDTAMEPEEWAKKLETVTIPLEKVSAPIYLAAYLGSTKTLIFNVEDISIAVEVEILSKKVAEGKLPRNVYIIKRPKINGQEVWDYIVVTGNVPENKLIITDILYAAEVKTTQEGFLHTLDIPGEKYLNINFATHVEKITAGSRLNGAEAIYGFKGNFIEPFGIGIDAELSDSIINKIKNNVKLVLAYDSAYPENELFAEYVSNLKTGNAASMKSFLADKKIKIKIGNKLIVPDDGAVFDNTVSKIFSVGPRDVKVVAHILLADKGLVDFNSKLLPLSKDTVKATKLIAVRSLRRDFIAGDLPAFEVVVSNPAKYFSDDFVLVEFGNGGEFGFQAIKAFNKYYSAKIGKSVSKIPLLRYIARYPKFVTFAGSILGFGSLAFLLKDLIDAYNAGKESDTKLAKMCGMAKEEFNSMMAKISEQLYSTYAPCEVIWATGDFSGVCDDSHVGARLETFFNMYANSPCKGFALNHWDMRNNKLWNLYLNMPMHNKCTMQLPLDFFNKETTALESKTLYMSKFVSKKIVPSNKCANYYVMPYYNYMPFEIDVDGTLSIGKLGLKVSSDGANIMYFTPKVNFNNYVKASCSNTNVVDGSFCINGDKTQDITDDDIYYIMLNPKSKNTFEAEIHVRWKAEYFDKGCFSSSELPEACSGIENINSKFYSSCTDRVVFRTNAAGNYVRGTWVAVNFGSGLKAHGYVQDYANSVCNSALDTGITTPEGYLVKRSAGNQKFLYICKPGAYVPAYNSDTHTSPADAQSPLKTEPYASNNQEVYQQVCDPVDADSDSFESGSDCADDRANVHWGASDNVCDGVDNNCNGIDDDEYVPYMCGIGACQKQSVCYGKESCTPLPASQEICDSIDNDCDGSTDEGNVCCANQVIFRTNSIGGDYASSTWITIDKGYGLAAYRFVAKGIEDGMDLNIYCNSDKEAYYYGINAPEGYKVKDLRASRNRLVICAPIPSRYEYDPNAASGSALNSHKTEPYASNKQETYKNVCSLTDIDVDGFLSDVDCADYDSKINPSAIDNTCDGKDDNCNGIDDDEYVSHSCSVNACQGTTLCKSAQEICNKLPKVIFRTNSANGNYASSTWVTIDKGSGLNGFKYYAQLDKAVYCDSDTKAVYWDIITPEGYNVKIDKSTSNRLYVCAPYYAVRYNYESYKGYFPAEAFSSQPTEPYTSNNQEVYTECT